MAACLGMSTDLFFPPENIGGPRKGRGVPGEKERIEQAKEICRRCPVRQECLEWSIGSPHRGMEVGIWGGMDTAERRKYASSG
jgi:WhiB family redox-sensing transcriptional regulator